MKDDVSLLQKAWAAGAATLQVLVGLPFYLLGYVLGCAIGAFVQAFRWTYGGWRS